jgi:hypothetical protein
LAGRSRRRRSDQLITEDRRFTFEKVAVHSKLDVFNLSMMTDEWFHFRSLQRDYELTRKNKSPPLMWYSSWRVRAKNDPKSFDWWAIRISPCCPKEGSTAEGGSINRCRCKSCVFESSANYTCFDTCLRCSSPALYFCSDGLHEARRPISELEAGNYVDGIMK